MNVRSSMMKTLVQFQRDFYTRLVTMRRASQFIATPAIA
jgi:hypothetical protein